MGVVYRVQDTHLHRPIALKFPLPGRHFRKGSKDRLLHEARAAAALDHPNICSIHEAGETVVGHLFLALPVYDGETLKARLLRDGTGLGRKAEAIDEAAVRWSWCPSSKTAGALRR